MEICYIFSEQLILKTSWKLCFWLIQVLPCKGFYRIIIIKFAESSYCRKNFVKFKISFLWKWTIFRYLQDHHEGQKIFKDCLPQNLLSPSWILCLKFFLKFVHSHSRKFVNLSSWLGCRTLWSFLISKLWEKKTAFSSYQAGIYLLKVNNEITVIISKICSKLTIKTPERYHWCRAGVFNVITVNFEQISHIVLVFTLLNLKK